MCTTVTCFYFCSFCNVVISMRTFPDLCEGAKARGQECEVSPSEKRTHAVSFWYCETCSQPAPDPPNNN